MSQDIECCRRKNSFIRESLGEISEGHYMAFEVEQFGVRTVTSPRLGVAPPAPR